jgi:energy-coupling factor transporter ATP-binding protein EcfA2
VAVVEVKVDRTGWRLGNDQSTMLGIEILLPDPEPSVGLPRHRGRIWLEGASGLHLLYGKNGSGKSTVLRALADLFEGRRSEAEVRCFVQLDKGLPKKDSEALGGNEYGELIPTARWEEFFRLAAHSFEKHCRREWPDEPHRAEFLSFAGIPGDPLFLSDDLIGDEEELMRKILDQDLESHWTALGRSGWEMIARYFLQLRVLRDCSVAVDGMDGESYAGDMIYLTGTTYDTDGGPLPGAIGEMAASRIIRFSPTGTDHPSWSIELAARLSEDTPCLRQIWSETQDALRGYLCRISPDAANSDADLARACELVLFNEPEWDTERDTLHEVPTGLLASKENIATMFGVLPESEHGLISTGIWQSGMAPVEFIPGWPTLLRLDDSIDPNDWVTDSFIDLFSDKTYPWLSDARRPSLSDESARVLEGFAGQGESWTTTNGPNKGRERSEGSYLRDSLLRKLSMEGVENVDVRVSEEVYVTWAGRSAPHLSAIAELPELEELRERVSRFGELLPRLKIGLGGLRLEPDWELPSWLKGTPARLEALDQPSDEWVGTAELSEAQQRWVANALTIGAAKEGGSEIVVIADEADAGVHVTASTSIFRTLSELPGIGFASSHSPTALRTPLARLLHVHRNADGNVTVGPAGLASDAKVSADKLGVDLIDLLATRYLTVIVEGAHDRAVLEGILDGEDHLDRMLIIEGRGTRTMTGIPDATLLVDFTDQQILVIVDNARNERLQPVVEALKLFQADGRSTKAALKESGFEGLRSGATPEERTLLEIIERSYSRRIIDRFGIHGLPTRDVAQLLPAELFGLEADWPKLEKDYKSDRTDRDFKTWLREERGVSITVRTIKKAVRNLDEYSPGLLAFREAVEVALDLATLEHGLSN